MLDLHHSWSRAWKGIGASANGEHIYSALVEKHNEPHRKYHTLQHLAECLSHFETVMTLPTHGAEVEFALWFHDAIYDVKSSGSEERSADWAKAASIESGVALEVAERIHSLVMVTKHTGVPVGIDEQVLVDIDLAILGASKERFAEYERQIRKEYADVPNWLFKRKRRAILRSFLDRPRIYNTSHFQAALEESARANLLLAIGKNAA
jgi:predicted metal-dependent HD superfamily phosphohydrolase